MANEHEKGKTMNKVVSEETHCMPELFVETSVQWLPTFAVDEPPPN